MKIPNFQRLSEQDFDEDDLTPLAQIINRPIDTATKALQKNISFDENIFCNIKKVTLDGTYPKFVSFDLKIKPTRMLVSSYSGLESLFSGSPFVLWEISARSIKINDVKGISPTTTNKIILELIIF